MNREIISPNIISGVLKIKGIVLQEMKTHCFSTQYSVDGDVSPQNTHTPDDQSCVKFCPLQNLDL